MTSAGTETTVKGVPRASASNEAVSFTLSRKHCQWYHFLPWRQSRRNSNFRKGMVDESAHTEKRAVKHRTRRARNRHIAHFDGGDD